MPLRNAPNARASLRAAIAADGFTLPGTLELPAGARGVVLFAQSRGNVSLSPQNRSLAGTLHAAGIGTLLFDLLTDREASDRDRVFDLKLLALRLLHATEWIEAQPESTGLPLGYCGSDTGAAAAVAAASQAGTILRAIVLRGGRPDLAPEFLPAVKAATLLIVGGGDPTVLRLNRSALDLLGGPKELAVVPGAMHDFEEPGALEAVGELATAWFRRHLGP